LKGNGQQVDVVDRGQIGDAVVTAVSGEVEIVRDCTEIVRVGVLVFITDKHGATRIFITNNVREVVWKLAHVEANA
jgi:hypothetical protein